MVVLRIILTIVFIICAVALAVIILMQKGKKAGLTGSIAGGSADTYWSKNKSRSSEGKLDFFTKIGVAVFIILALFINIVL